MLQRKKKSLDFWKSSHMGEGKGHWMGCQEGILEEEEVKHILGNGKESMFFMKTSRKNAHQFLNEPTNHR